MTSQPSPTAPRPLASALPLVLGLGAAVLAGGAVATVLANSLGWTAPEAGMTVSESVFAGAASMAFAAAVGLSFLWSAASRSLPRFGLMVVAASTTRMLIAMTALVVLLFAGKPAIYPLVASLAAGFLLCLIFESLWAMAALKRAHPAAPSPASSLHTGAVVR